MNSRFFVEKVTEIAGGRVILLDVKIEQGHVCGGDVAWLETTDGAVAAARQGVVIKSIALVSGQTHAPGLTTLSISPPDFPTRILEGKWLFTGEP